MHVNSARGVPADHARRVAPGVDDDEDQRARRVQTEGAGRRGDARLGRRQRPGLDDEEPTRRFLSGRRKKNERAGDAASEEQGRKRVIQLHFNLRV